MNIPALKAMLEQHEGLRLKPYTDTVGKLTIGVGRNLDDVGISTDEAMYLLDSDIDRVTKALDKSMPWWTSLSENRQLVLANMCFNLGIVRLLLFKDTIAAIEGGDYIEAAKEMLDSRWAIQTKDRATELAQMMKDG